MTSLPKKKVFAAYVRLWCAANALRVISGFVPGTALKDSVQAQPVWVLLGLFAAAAAVPYNTLVSGLALAVRIVTNARKGPWMGNSQLWATQMDLAVLWALLRARKWRLSASDENEVVDRCAEIVRWQLAVFYFASAFWKLNTSFCHPKYSCASIFCVQPFEYLPDRLLFESSVVKTIVEFVASAAPWLTLLVEAFVPVLHVIETPWAVRIGVFTTVSFHLLIGLTPPPSNVSSFGVTTCTRLFFCMPAQVTETLAEPLVLAVAAVAPAIALAIVDPFHRDAVSTVQGAGRDLQLAYYAALSVVLCRAAAAATFEKKERDSSHPNKKAFRIFVGAAILYAFAFPVLGLQEKGGCLMFSQLRMHGGSNHYLLPTALLQRWLVDASPANAFAGGVVRIEATNLTWIGNAFAQHASPRTLRLVRDVAGVPSEYIWAAKHTTLPRAEPPPRFMPHTLSNLGFRRLLETAKKQAQPAKFLYRRLYGAAGDERWRTLATANTKTVYLTLDSEGAIVSCEEDAVLRLPCDQREKQLLAPPKDLAFLATMLLPQPNPIVDGYTDEMHCVTWG